MNKEQLDQIK